MRTHCRPTRQRSGLRVHGAICTLAEMDCVNRPRKISPVRFSFSKTSEPAGCKETSIKLLIGHLQKTHSFISSAPKADLEKQRRPLVDGALASMCSRDRAKRICFSV